MPNGDFSHPVYITRSMIGYKLAIEDLFEAHYDTREYCPNCGWKTLNIEYQLHEEPVYCPQCGTCVRKYTPKCILLDEPGNQRAYELAFNTQHPGSSWVGVHGYTMEDDYDKGLLSFAWQAFIIIEKWLAQGEVRIVKQERHQRQEWSIPEFWFLGVDAQDAPFVNREAIRDMIHTAVEDLLGIDQESLSAGKFGAYSYSEYAGRR